MAKTIPYGAIWEIVNFEYQNGMNESFTMGMLSDEHLLKFKLCADECFHIFESSKGFRKNGSENMFLIPWCNRSKQNWFHKLYYEMWQRSPEIKLLTHVVQPYVAPTLLAWGIVELTILSALLICFNHLRKSNPFWWFFMCYCLSSGLGLVVVSLVFNIIGKSFPKNNIFCRGQQYLSLTLSAIPNWIFAEALINQTLTSLRTTSLPPVEVIGTKIIIICSVVAVIVLSTHSLWLYSVDQFEKTCNMLSHDPVLIVGYPIYLEVRCLFYFYEKE